MGHFESLFAAYVATWAVFFVFEITVSRRVSRLRDELARLKDRLKKQQQ